MTSNKQYSEESKMIQNNHPYKDLEGTELWKKVSQCIDDLVKNQDINITTKKECVIGYLCKMIVETKE